MSEIFVFQLFDSLFMHRYKFLYQHCSCSLDLGMVLTAVIFVIPFAIILDITHVQHGYSNLGSFIYKDHFYTLTTLYMGASYQPETL